jgi:hypothetical protein
VSTLSVKRLVLISASLFLAIVVVYLLMNLNNSVKLKEIESKRDVRLQSYDYAKGISLGVLDLLRMDTQAEYTTSKEQFRKTMSRTLWDEYFSSDKYVGSKKNFTIALNGSSGEILSDKEFLFKLEFTLSGGGNGRPSVLLVRVKDNIIQSVQSLG